MNAWLNKLYETFIETGHYNLIIEGFKNTILITLGALLIGVVIGMIIAVVKYFAEDVKALKPLAYICDFYVTAVRGIPVVVTPGANNRAVAEHSDHIIFLICQ